MSRAQVEDSFLDHPRTINLSLAAQGLWLRGCLYCNRHLTDGFVPKNVVALTPDEATATACAELLESGLWESVDRGFQVRNWLKYNWSKDEVLARREAKSKAGKSGGLASATARATASATAKPKHLLNGLLKQNPSNTNNTDTDVNEIDKSISPPFGDFYVPWPRKEGKRDAEKAWGAMTQKDRKKVLSVLDQWITYFSDRDSNFIPFPATFLRRRDWENDVPQPRKVSEPTRDIHAAFTYPNGDEDLIDPEWQAKFG